MKNQEKIGKSMVILMDQEVRRTDYCSMLNNGVTNHPGAHSYHHATKVYCSPTLRQIKFKL